MTAGRRRGRVTGVVLASLALCIFGCRGREHEPDPRPSAATDADDWFVDAAAATGLDFVHRSGRSGHYYMPEIMSGGAALFDYDNDGDLDVYVVQSGRLEPPGDATGRSSEPRVGQGADRLYRNDLVPGGRLHFTDVTAKSGISTRGYGQGVAVGDYDGDGFQDLYVTSFGPNQLLRNQGDGTFRDVTAEAHADDPRWSTSASFFDYDRDGRLDLYVANYVEFAFPIDKPCFLHHGQREYCGPQAFEPLPHRLLRNRGDGAFEDVSERAGILAARSSGLGVSAADLDGDGWLDLYVANDRRENFLWLNQRNGTFKNVALENGAALSFDGSAEASMGVDAGDFDGDGDEDVFVTNMTGEKNTLYVNEGRALFSDLSFKTGVGRSAQATTGFGTAWLDYDNDGWLDLFVANGRVIAVEEQLRAKDPFPYREPNQLFRNQGDGTLRDVSASAGTALRVSAVHRGAAFGDVDNDGDTDVLVTQVDGPLQLLINQVGSRQHWLGARLVSGRGDAVGAWAVFRRDGTPPLWRRARADGSYLCANDPRITFGLGQDPRGGTLEVAWPDGRRERFRDLPIDRYSQVTQGRGEPLP